jgi:hypothetical protein
LDEALPGNRPAKFSRRSARGATADLSAMKKITMSMLFLNYSSTAKASKTFLENQFGIDEVIPHATEILIRAIIFRVAASS